MGADGAGGCGTGARMLSSCERVWLWPLHLHCVTSPLLFPECQAHTTEHDWGMGGELECLDSKSILCLAAVWVQVCICTHPCVCVCAFFFFQHNALICLELHSFSNTDAHN